MGGISIWQLLIVFAIVVLIFGTKKLRGMGSDLGGAIKSFKQAVNEEDNKKEGEEEGEEEPSIEKKESAETAEKDEKSQTREKS